MPADVITLNAVAKELNNILSGGRIEKIYQPENDEITLAVRNKGAEKILVISANPSHPRIHITTQKKENSLNAPAFCMLLRKYLTSGTISSVEIFNCDRVIKITVEARNELKDKTRYFIMAELMGRYSNIILIDENNTIIDAIRRIHLDQSTTRYIIPNLTYPIQPQSKIRLDDTNSLNDFFAQNDNLSQDILMRNISGISKETAKEIVSKKEPLQELLTFYNINENKRYYPCILKKSDMVKDYYILPYNTIAGEYLHLATLNECLDSFYSIYDKTERKKANTKNLNQLLKRLQTKTNNRISDCYSKIQESEKAEQIKQKGDLILSNIYKINRGDKQLQCFDYYNNIDAIIELDVLLSPSENAQSYFKRYGKLKRAKNISEQQLVDLNIQKDYLDSIESSIQNCETKQEFEEILQELHTLSGAKKQQKSSKTKQKPSKPLHINIDGFDVFIGKNSLQNVEVTFKIGESNDIWLHAKNYHGSHVIIKGEPNENVLHKSAAIAAYFSGGRNSDKVEVDFTFRKNVKKIANSFMGLVTYSNHKTILVKPNLPENFL